MLLHNHIHLPGRTFPQAGAIVGFWVHNFTRAPACPGSGPARKSSLRELSKYPALIPPLALGKSVRERKLCTNLLSSSPLFLLHLFPLNPKALNIGNEQHKGEATKKSVGPSCRLHRLCLSSSGFLPHCKLRNMITLNYADYIRLLIGCASTASFMLQ